MHTSTPSSCCPRDGGMLRQLDKNKILVSRCGDCHGLWIPKDQLVGKLSANLIGKLYHVPTTQVTDLRCPLDGSALLGFTANGVTLDRCPACGGLWFDAGELETVLSNTRYTTFPRKALDATDTVTATELLLGAVDVLTPSSAEQVWDVVVEIISGIASSISP